MTLEGQVLCRTCFFGLSSRLFLAGHRNGAADARGHDTIQEGNLRRTLLVLTSEGTLRHSGNDGMGWWTLLVMTVTERTGK